MFPIGTGWPVNSDLSSECVDVSINEAEVACYQPESPMVMWSGAVPPIIVLELTGKEKRKEKTKKCSVGGMVVVDCRFSTHL